MPDHDHASPGPAPYSAAGQPAVRNVALVAAGDTPQADVARFGEVLGSFPVQAFAGGGAEPANRAGGPGDGSHRRRGCAEAAGLTGWLSDQEDRHDLVLYAPAPRPDSQTRDRGAPGFWDRLCVRQADVVLLVGRAGASPRLGAAEQRLLAGSTARKARRELVLLHDDLRPGTWQTERWLSNGSSAGLTHHVVPEPAHLGRLARFLLDVPVGLVLSGGGIRGFGHAGVLRALREHGVPVDVICGTSAGALVGGQFAMGWTPGQIERRDVEAVRRSPAAADGLHHPHHVNRRFCPAQPDPEHHLQRTIRIEDLWIPLLCTISDLTAAELIVRDTGSLRDSVRASCSLPVAAPASGGAMMGTCWPMAAC